MIDCLKYFPEINTSYRTEKKIIFDHDVKIWFQKLQKLKKLNIFFQNELLRVYIMILKISHVFGTLTRVSYLDLN